MHIECGAFVYRATPSPAPQQFFATLRETESGLVQCECIWMEPDDFYNTYLACSILVTECTT